jgi:muramidase (phage lysozyme)
MPGVAYNPYDSAQQKLLGALSLSEVGTAKNAQFLGTGGYDLSDAPTDQYGFPQWGGITTHAGPSHAAGFFQFQPGTWESYAKQYDLDFQDASDQKAAAWYLAQDTYRKETGGDLSTAIQSGNYSSIESALGKTQWIGARGKLAQFLESGKTRPLPDDAGQISEDASMSGGMWNPLRPFANGGAGFKSAAGAVGDFVSRYLVFIIGALILLAAVWWLLSDAGIAPGPGTVKTVAKLASSAS